LRLEVQLRLRERLNIEQLKLDEKKRGDEIERKKKT